MRRTVIAALAVLEATVACAIFACSLELSHAIARSTTIGHVAHIVVHSAHRLANVQFSISIGHA